MINRKTVTTLGLKPMTRDMCYDFYVKINSECKTPDAIRESVSWWQTDDEKLNHLWWVLNYYSDRLDPDRNLRAYVEKHLDTLAEETAFQAELNRSDVPEEEAEAGKLAV
ncbi:MAG: hypothetical protein MI802_04035 [Desulfobacterales bacterium]|nr:hypothetical protein [Desulfobacterales bacterium]